MGSRWWTSQLPRDLEPQWHINKLSDSLAQAMTVPRLTIKNQNVAAQSLEISAPSQTVGIILLVNLCNYPACKSMPHHVLRPHSASATAYTLVCGMCFFLNKPTSYLSFCLSLNSFCDETSRTWASLGPETGCCDLSWKTGFWLCSSPSPMGSSPRLSWKWSESVSLSLWPLDDSLPGSSVHAILQARVLEWVSRSLFQGIISTRRSNPGLPHCRRIPYRLRHQRRPQPELMDDIIGRASQVTPVVKNPSASAGDTRDLGSIPGWGRSPGAGCGNPLQHSCLENPINRGAQRATVHRVSKSQTRLKRLSMHTHDATRDWEFGFIWPVGIPCQWIADFWLKRNGTSIKDVVARN